MTCAANHTEAEPTAPLASAGDAPLMAFVRALIAWLMGFAPVERFRRGAQRLLAEIACVFADPDFWEGELIPSDARDMARMLDVADALVSAHVWLLARTKAGLPLRACSPPRKPSSRKPPTRAAIVARFRSIRVRLAAAEAKAARLASNMTASDAIDPISRPEPDTLPASHTPAPITTDAPFPSRRVRAGLIERALAIAGA